MHELDTPAESGAADSSAFDNSGSDAAYDALASGISEFQTYAVDDADFGDSDDGGDLDAGRTADAPVRGREEAVEPPSTEGEEEGDDGDPLLEAFADDLKVKDGEESDEDDEPGDLDKGDAEATKVDSSKSKSKDFSTRLAEAQEKIRAEERARYETDLAELQRLREERAQADAERTRAEAEVDIEAEIDGDFPDLRDYDEVAFNALKNAKLAQFDADQKIAQATAKEQQSAQQRVEAERLRVYSEFMGGQEGSVANVPMLHKSYAAPGADPMPWMNVAAVIHNNLAQLEGADNIPPFAEFAKMFHDNLKSVHDDGVRAGIERARRQATRSKSAPQSNLNRTGNGQARREVPTSSDNPYDKLVPAHLR